jgi:hypothetical protein
MSDRPFIRSHAYGGRHQARAESPKLRLTAAAPHARVRVVATDSTQETHPILLEIVVPTVSETLTPFAGRASRSKVAVFS